MGIRSQKPAIPKSHIAQDALEQTEMIFQGVRKNAMQTYIKYKAYYGKNQMPLNPKIDITSVWYNLKQIIKAVTFFSQTSVGLGPTSLKKLYVITTLWYAISEQRKRRSFIARNYDLSRLENPNVTSKLRHKDGDMTLKSLENMMIRTPEHGCVILENFLQRSTRSQPS